METISNWKLSKWVGSNLRSTALAANSWTDGAALLVSRRESKASIASECDEEGTGRNRSTVRTQHRDKVLNFDMVRKRLKLRAWEKQWWWGVKVEGDRRWQVEDKPRKPIEIGNVKGSDVSEPGALVLCYGRLLLHDHVWDLILRSILSIQMILQPSNNLTSFAPSNTTSCMT